MDRLLEEYQGRIKIVYYHVTYSEKSYRAAEAALCAGAQGKYWEYHDRLFDRQKQWSNAAKIDPYLVGYARDMGLDAGGFKSCLKSGKMSEYLNKDKKTAMARSVRSTPTIFVGSKRIVGAKPHFLYKSVIEEQLKSR